MRYVAVLNGKPEVLEQVALCFTSDIARIKKLGDKWVLESSNFDSCCEPSEVFPIADRILGRIHRILMVYSGLQAPSSVAYIQGFHADGTPSEHAIRGSTLINIYSSAGLVELAAPCGTHPRGAAILERATDDPKVTEALNLVGDQELNWSQIYDVIEFLGGAKEIASAGWAHKSQTRDIRQTANHHRHLGSRKRYPLPAKPPTINEARMFASRLLQRWMASQLCPVHTETKTRKPAGQTSVSKTH